MPFDKWLHLIVGAALGATAVLIGGVLALALAAAAAIGKELIDYATHGEPDWLDALTTVVGCGIVVAGLSWLT